MGDVPSEAVAVAVADNAHDNDNVNVNDHVPPRSRTGHR